MQRKCVELQKVLADQAGERSGVEQEKVHQAVDDHVDTAEQSSTKGQDDRKPLFSTLFQPLIQF